MSNVPYHIQVMDAGGRITSDPNEVKSPFSGRLFIILLFGIIIVFLFIMLLFGVNIYDTTNKSRVENDERRLGLSLIANSIRMNDVTDAVGVGQGPEGRSLVLTENIEGVAYETRIYTYEGKIVQEYAMAQTPYTPTRTREIVASSRFEFEYRNGLLTVYTDQGETSVAFRSVRKGT